MKQTFTLLALFLVLPLLTLAQTNYKKGLVVTTEGDTLHGYIDYREWLNNPFSFASTPDGKAVQQYTPGNCLYFAITGMEAYQRYQGPISMDYTRDSKLSVGRDTSAADVVAFLKVLTTGPKLSLLSYTDNLKVRYFLDDTQGGNVYELLYKKYLVETAEGRKINTLKLYTGQLQLAAAQQGLASERLKQRINAANYEASDLGAVVKQLNGEEQADEKKDEDTHKAIRLFAGPGFARNTTTFSGTSDFRNAGPSISQVPTLSMGVDMFANSNTKRLFLRVELTLAPTNEYNFDDRKTRSYTQTSYNELNYQFAQNTVSVTPQVLYNMYSKPNFQLFLGCGAGMHFSSYPKDTYTDTYVINSEEGIAMAPMTMNDRFAFQKFWATLPLKAGVVLYNKAEVYCRYDAPSTITNMATYSLVTFSVQVGANFLINL